MMNIWRSNMKSGRGQSALEYSLLLVVLCLVFITMSTYMKNGVRSKIYIVQKRLNEAGSASSMPAVAATISDAQGSNDPEYPEDPEDPIDPHHPPLEPTME